jgi:plasmid stability protein
MARLVVRDWPDDIHTKLKLEAVKRGVGLREILLEAVKGWLKGKGREKQ